MKFRISGADRRTGKDIKRFYEADTEDAALALANMDGVMVAGAELVPYTDGDRQTATQPPPVAYRSPTTLGSVPTYSGLSIASVVLRVYAGLCYVLGGLALIATVIGIATAFSNSGNAFGASLGIATAGPALALLFVAAFSHGLSAACVALRDIARNSWR